MNNNFSLLLSGVLCWRLLLSQVALAGQADVTREMTEAVSSMSLAELSIAIDSNRWFSPSIYSKWNLTHQQREPGDYKSAVLAREFGLAAARRLDEWATGIVRQTGADDTAAAVTSLLALADWFAASQGYGNVILASRCQDVAAVGIGRLVADLKYPFGAVSSMVTRLEAPWRSPHARAAVLNLDAGAPIFSTSSQQAEPAQKQIEETWQNGEVLKLQKDNPQVAPRATKPIEAPILVENLDFFRDDEIARCPRPMTTVSMWETKQHRRLVFGMNTENARALKALLLFRQYVGDFPQRIVSTPAQEAAAKAEAEAAARSGIKIVSFESAYPSPGAAAFAKAWSPRSALLGVNLDVIAWQAYSAIKAGQFLDDDTRARHIDAQTVGVVDPNAR